MNALFLAEASFTEWFSGITADRVCSLVFCILAAILAARLIKRWLKRLLWLVAILLALHFLIPGGLLTVLEWIFGLFA